MPKTATLDIFVIVDSNGDYAIGMDVDSVYEAFDDQIGGQQPRRMFQLKVMAEMPAETDSETRIEVPASAQKPIEARVEPVTESSYANG